MGIQDLGFIYLSEGLVLGYFSAVFVPGTTRPLAIFLDSQTDEAKHIVVAVAVAGAFCMFAAYIVLYHISADRA